MSQQELLTRLVEVLDRAGIDYMLTGSHSSSLQGEPRSTHDIDLIVDFPLASIGMLLAAFPPPEFYLSEPAMREAIQRQSMFNLLHVDEGDKVDFWILTDEPFDQSRFARKQVADLGGPRVKVSAPEDTILAKLRWANLSGGSQKQMQDALRVYEVQAGVLDHAYLERWARQLGVDPLWEELKQQAQPLSDSPEREE